jgi:serine/threonine-protein kinase
VRELIGKREELLSRAHAESGTGRFGLERYRVIRPIGHGGMAEVLLAVRHGIGGFEKPIALKKIRRAELEPAAVERLLDEARLAAGLSHPSIAQIFEVGEQDGELYLAMEYVHGVDLLRLGAEVRARGSSLPLAVVLHIGARVAAALHHAHAARDLAGRPLGLVHCDVSPSNVMIGFDGQVKLVDFGVARAFARHGDASPSWGKRSYMSPEQRRGEPLDGRSDVFSLGVVLHELLSGRSLFGGQGPDAVISAPIPSLAASGVPPAVEQIVKRALARPREERPASARALQVALERALASTGGAVGDERLAELLAELLGPAAARAAILLDGEGATGPVGST